MEALCPSFHVGLETAGLKVAMVLVDDKLSIGSSMFRRRLNDSCKAAADCPGSGHFSANGFFTFQG
jgi:hypothetical protein